MDESTTRRFNKGHRPTSSRDQLDAKTQDPVSLRVIESTSIRWHGSGFRGPPNLPLLLQPYRRA
jgi:hypothetical protein